MRVSTLEQNTGRQLEQIPVDRVFADKASGKDTQRPELERLIAFVREGDTVVVQSMDRLARNGRLDNYRLLEKNDQLQLVFLRGLIYSYMRLLE